MKRRAGSEIFGIMAVGTALAISMGIVVDSSAEIIYGNKITVKDAIDSYKGQISEMIQVVDSSNNPASAEIINYGPNPVIIDEVRIDSVNTTYRLYEYDSQGIKKEIHDISSIPTEKLVRIDAVGGADSMQILTSSANIIEIDLHN